MIRVTVRLNGGLERYASMRHLVEVCVEDGATLASVQERLGIPRGEVGLFVVNRQLLNEDAPVPDGSIVDLYPMFGGG